MKYCFKCNVSINSAKETCPLCQGLVEDGKTDDVFPYAPTIYKKYSFFFRLLVFISLLISTICILINILIETKVFWSIFVLAGFACLLILLKISIDKHKNIPRTILWQIITISILSLLWDYFTGWHGWSITYVIPVVCMVGSIDLLIIVKVMKMYITDYLFYFLLTIFLGFVPAIFWLTGVVQIYYPSIICTFLNLITLIAMFVFSFDFVVEELKRRLHL